MSQTDSGGREWKARDVVIMQDGFLVRFEKHSSPNTFTGLTVNSLAHSDCWMTGSFVLCCQTCHCATGGARWCAEHTPEEWQERHAPHIVCHNCEGPLNGGNCPSCTPSPARQPEPQCTCPAASPCPVHHAGMKDGKMPVDLEVCGCSHPVPDGENCAMCGLPLEHPLVQQVDAAARKDAVQLVRSANSGLLSYEQEIKMLRSSKDGALAALDQARAEVAELSKLLSMRTAEKLRFGQQLAEANEAYQILETERDALREQFAAAKIRREKWRSFATTKSSDLRETRISLSNLLKIEAEQRQKLAARDAEIAALKAETINLTLDWTGEKERTFSAKDATIATLREELSRHQGCMLSAVIEIEDAFYEGYDFSTKGDLTRTASWDHSTARLQALEIESRWKTPGEAI